MSKERQRRRAEREAERQRAEAERTLREARLARRRARYARLTRFVPHRSGRPGGILARRRREQNAIVVLAFLLVQVVIWINVPSWIGRIAALVLSVFLIPVFITLAFDRRS
jgi:Flp pilus assembly protein TadB